MCQESAPGKSQPGFQDRRHPVGVARSRIPGRVRRVESGRDQGNSTSRAYPSPCVSQVNDGDGCGHRKGSQGSQPRSRRDCRTTTFERSLRRRPPGTPTAQSSRTTTDGDPRSDNPTLGCSRGRPSGHQVGVHPFTVALPTTLTVTVPRVSLCLVPRRRPDPRRDIYRGERDPG